MNLALPFQFDHRGRTAQTSEPRYVRDLIEAVLFTVPGERVMRPDFGSGVAQLVFAPNSPELAAATQMLVQGSLTRWLSDLITVSDVRVEAEESVLRVIVVYALRGSEQRRVETFEREGGM
jgi:phage baseplate assembly protein W